MNRIGLPLAFGVVLLAFGGKLPLLAEVGRAEVSLAVPAGDWTCWALETDGTRRSQIPVAFKDGRLQLTADIARNPAAATILYELIRP